jgi:hypothetical protein
MVKAAVALLPPAGEEVEFDTYKAKLYSEYPDGGRDSFAHMIKRDVVNKKLRKNADGKPVVMLSRKA